MPYIHASAEVSFTYSPEALKEASNKLVKSGVLVGERGLNVSSFYPPYINSSINSQDTTAIKEFLTKTLIPILREEQEEFRKICQEIGNETDFYPNSDLVPVAKSPKNTLSTFI